LHESENTNKIINSGGWEGAFRIDLSDAWDNEALKKNAETASENLAPNLIAEE
jgi:hypothetical protein